MKILILSRDIYGETGGVSAALADACRKSGIEYEVTDPSVIVSEVKDESAGSGIIKRTHKKLMGVVQKAGDFLDRAMGLSSVDLTSSESSEKLFSYINEGVFDAVICACPQATSAMGAVRKLKGSKVPCYGVLSDYFIPPYLEDTGLDGYFIPHSDLRNAKGIQDLSDGSVFVSGIPVRQRFGSDFSKKEARNYLIIPKSRRVYLILSQGMSRNTVIGVCDELIKSEAGDYAVYVLAERGSEILEKLSDRYACAQQMHIVTFTEKFSVYMKAADAVIAKPYAQTVTEAAVAGVPLVLISPDSEAQFRNSDFAASHEVAVTANGSKDAAAKAQRFALENALAARIVKMQDVNILRGAADKILELVTQKRAAAL